MKLFRSLIGRKIIATAVKAGVLLLSSVICIASLVAIASNMQNISEDMPTSSNQKVHNFLIMGVDNSERLTDVIMLVSLDTGNKTMTVAQIPRDTYAEYTDAAYRKLNGAMASLGSGREVADFLESSFGITIDHYITVDLDGLGKVVDMIGGVEVNIPEDMTYTDSYQDLQIELKAGKKLLSGEEAKQFIRYRAGYLRGDIGRLDAQKLFLAALGLKLFGKSPIELVRPMSVLISCSESDLDLPDCMDFISNATKIESKDISFLTLPGSDVRTESGSWYYILNRPECEKIISSRFGGEDSCFDPGRLFTGEYSDEFNSIYDASEGYEAKIYTADHINQGGIEIPRS